MPSFGGFLSTSNWEESPWYQSSLEVLHISSGLGIHLDSQAELKMTEGHLKILAQPAAAMTQPQKSRRKWMNGLLPMTIITFLSVLVLVQFANMYSLNLSLHI